MIKRLRSRHRVFWTVLAILLPVLFAWAILGRSSEPIVDELPAALAESNGALE